MRVTSPLTLRRLPLGLFPLLGATVLALTGCGGQDHQPAATAAAQAEVAAAERAETARRQEAELERLRDEVRAEKRKSAMDAQGSRSESSGGTSGGATGDDGLLLSAADRKAFTSLESRLGGRSGVAVSRVGRGQPVTSAGSFQSAVAWSTSKVPVAMAAIAAGSGTTAALRSAITASDNAAAETLWNGLGGGQQAASATDAQLRASGDERTQTQASALRSGFTAFGQTSWTLPDQTAFTAGLPCTAPGREVLGLMADTVSAQRWGLGSTSWSASLKGGWGPGAQPGQDGGYIDRQMGILERDGRRFAVSIMTQPANGSHEAGIANLDEIARWVVDRVARRASSAPPSC